MLKKTFVFILGLVCILLIAELSLRFIGVHQNKRPIQATFYKGQNLIVCLGNSFTEGRGAPPDKSYPAQLEKLLQRNFPNENFKVLNLGSSGINTRQTIKQVQKISADLSPASFFIVQAGQPNWWNYIGYAEYLESVKEKAHWFYRAYSSLNHSHLFRFAVRLLAPAQAIQTSACQEDSSQNLKEVLDQVTWYSTREKNISKEVLRKAQDIERSFIQKNSLAPYGPRYAFLSYLAFTFFKDEKKSFEYLKEGILKGQCPPSNLDFNPYAMFRRLEDKWKGQKLKQELSIFKSDLRRNSPIKAEWLKGNLASISSWTKSDLKELVHLLRQTQAKIIIQNYPPLPKGFYSEEINRVLREVAREENLPFLDNEQFFAKLWAEGKNRTDYHSPDEHLNAKGYGLQAEKLFELIKSIK